MYQLLWLCVRIHPEEEYSLCRLAATAFLSHTLLIQSHSSSQTTENRSVIFFLFSFLFFFSQLFILIIFISLSRHRYRAVLCKKFSGIVWIEQTLHTSERVALLDCAHIIIADFNGELVILSVFKQTFPSVQLLGNPLYVCEEMRSRCNVNK